MDEEEIVEAPTAGGIQCQKGGAPEHKLYKENVRRPYSAELNSLKYIHHVIRRDHSSF
jgi:hypothetical protein